MVPWLRCYLVSHFAVTVFFFVIYMKMFWGCVSILLIIKHPYTHTHGRVRLAYIDDSCMNQFLIRWLQNGDFLAPRFLLYLLVGILLKEKLSLLPSYFPFPCALFAFSEMNVEYGSVNAYFIQLSYYPVLSLIVLVLKLSQVIRLCQWNCPPGGSYVIWSIFFF